MQISRFSAWSIHLPYVEGVYRMSGDRITSGMDAVVVRLVAEDGTVGLGESGTVGVTFDAQNMPGQVAGITALSKAVLGADAANPKALFRRMTAAMTGHPTLRHGIFVLDCTAFRSGSCWAATVPNPHRFTGRCKVPRPRCRRKRLWNGWIRGIGDSR
jgi:hypothetical protein